MSGWALSCLALLFLSLPACRSSSAVLHIEVSGDAVEMGRDFDALRLEVRREGNTQVLAQEDVTGAELHPLPYTFNILSGSSTPVGTSLQITIRALHQGQERMKAVRSADLEKGVQRLQLKLSASTLDPDGGSPDSGTPDSGTPDSGTPDAGCVPVTEVCSNSLDDDCDGQPDCADSDCNNQACGANGRVCTGSVCLCGGEGLAQTVEQSCGDNRDNDCDGARDCADSNCTGQSCSSTNARSVCDAANACSCNGRAASADATRSGRSSIVPGVGGTVKVLYTAVQGTTGVYYTECTAGCSGSNPVFSTPLLLGALDRNANLRPTLLATSTGGVVATFRTNSPAEEVHFLECTAGCTQSSGWTRKVFDGTGATVAAAVRGTTRAVAYQFFDGTNSAGVYAECTAGASCANAGSTWTTVQLPVDPFGAQIVLSGLPDGGTRRNVVFGTEDTSSMLYATCTANCGTAANWQQSTLPAGQLPDLVLDSAGFPRVFSHSAAVPSALRCTRCTQSPCTTAANWTTTTLQAQAGYVSAGVQADGGTYFLTSLSGGVVMGTESPAGYSQGALSGCTGLLLGDSPTGAQDLLGRWHYSYGNGAAQQQFSEVQ